MLIDTLMIDRETKFNRMFKAEVLSNADLDNEPPENENELTNRKVRQVNKALADYDSDEERENANLMFMNDLQYLRKYFIKVVSKQIEIQETMEATFNSERKFFLECTQKGQNNQDGLKSTIAQLQRELQDERQYSMHVWADQQVSLMCQKSLFTFKYHQRNQADKIEGIDTRQKPEGHFIVTKQEQDEAFGEAREDSERMSEISQIPTPTMEQHLVEVEHLKWQIEYERKLSQEMNQLLEDKVSKLMATKDEHAKQIQKQTQVLQVLNADKAALGAKIEALEGTVRSKDAEIVDLRNRIDDLETQGGPLSQTTLQKVRAELARQQTDNEQKASKICQLEQDLNRAVSSLRDFHTRMVKLNHFANSQTSQLQDLVDTKIKEQNCRIVAMTDIFKEALMLSNKTYFLEEMSKQRNIQKDLRRQLKIKEALIGQSEMQNAVFRAQLEKLKAEMLEAQRLVETPVRKPEAEVKAAVAKAPIAAIPEISNESLRSHDSGSKDLSALEIVLAKSQVPELVHFASEVETPIDSKKKPSGMRRLVTMGPTGGSPGTLAKRSSPLKKLSGLFL